jgi:cytochrome d ubiquinol oxidase subunit II
VISLQIQPQILLNLSAHPWGFFFPAIVIASLAGIFYYLRGVATPTKARLAFLHSCGYLFGMLTSVAFGLYPYVLPARAGPALSLSIYNSRTSDHALRIGLAWWIVGMILAAVYFIFLYRRFSGPVRPGETHSYD